MGIFAFRRLREQEAAKVASVPPKPKKKLFVPKKTKVNGNNHNGNSRKRVSK